jgi:transposase
MARRGRPTVKITLSGDERKTLQRWARRHSSAQALALRCRIVLACAEGRTDRDVAAELRINPVTVSKWRHRFATDRLDGLMDAPRPGAARTIGDDVVEAVVVDTLESAPADATHWSTRGLAAKHGISRQTVSEIWRAFGLKPWREDSFKVSPDPDLVEKIRDIVALYLNPPVAAVVFAVDEKPQIQALNRTAPTLPMLPTTPARATHDYERNGTCDLFAALNIASGTVITDIRKTHTSEDFIAFLNKVNRNVPSELDVHVVLDNPDLAIIPIPALVPGEAPRAGGPLCARRRRGGQDNPIELDRSFYWGVVPWEGRNGEQLLVGAWWRTAGLFRRRVWVGVDRARLHAQLGSHTCGADGPAEPVDVGGRDRCCRPQRGSDREVLRCSEGWRTAAGADGADTRAAVRLFEEPGRCPTTGDRCRDAIGGSTDALSAPSTRRPRARIVDRPEL